MNPTEGSWFSWLKKWQKGRKILLSNGKLGLGVENIKKLHSRNYSRSSFAFHLTRFDVNQVIGVVLKKQAKSTTSEGPPVIVIENTPAVILAPPIVVSSFGTQTGGCPNRLTGRIAG
jgi:hypothetical protein